MAGGQGGLQRHSAGVSTLSACTASSSAWPASSICLNTVMFSYPAASFIGCTVPAAPNGGRLAVNCVHSNVQTYSAWCRAADEKKQKRRLATNPRCP